MRIAIATEFFFPHVGGTEFRLHEIAKRLVARGHDVHVFTVRYDNEIPREEEIDGIHIHRYAQGEGYETSDGLRSIRGIVRYGVSTMIRAAANNFDIWYFGQWPMIHSLLTRPVVSPIVQEWCEIWLRRIVFFEKAMARATTHHVAVGESVKRRLVEFLHVKDENVTVIHSGINVASFRGNRSEKKWGRIVYVGRLAPHKRLDLLLNAYRIAKAEAPEIELHLAGSGTCLPRILREASKLDDVYVYGRIAEAEKIDLLRTAWLFAIPSEREGLPHAPLEAMAAGTPVLTVDYPDNGTTEICRDGNGIVTSPEPHALAHNVTQILHDEHSWAAMSARASSFAEKFDWESTADEFERYLKTVVYSQTESMSNLE
jgi:glycosyltransferase involved in cell wall biosynthesis